MSLASPRDATDMHPRSVQRLLEVFRAVHQGAARGLPSVEVGTYRGGSAGLMLTALDELYEPGKRPMLFTVDPYGGKPYQGGDTILPNAYRDEHYIEAKARLAPWANHAHFLMTGEHFLRSWGEWDFWQGSKLQQGGLAFVLLDGDHDFSTIRSEVTYCLGLVQKGGVVLIDNIDKDPEVLPWLEQYPLKAEICPSQEKGGAQALIRFA